MLFVNRRTRNTGAELPVELGTRPGPVTKIRYRWVCERPVDLLLNLGTLSKRTIYRYAAEPMVLSSMYSLDPLTQGRTLLFFFKAITCVYLKLLSTI